MADAQLAQDLRSVLNQYAMTNALINAVVSGELKESWIAQRYPFAVATLSNRRVDFTHAVHNALAARGVAWGGVTYNLGPLGLRQMTRLVATEELSAIHDHGPTPGFDAAKGLTNMLRLIKTAEKP